MNKMQKMVQDFHIKFGHTNNTSPRLISKELSNFREELIDEENQELKDAFNDKNLVEVADAIGDLLYVLFETACSLGIDIEPVFEEIHRSNMSKSPSGSNCRKQLKGSNYFKPNIKLELDKQMILDGFKDVEVFNRNELDESK